MLFPIMFAAFPLFEAIRGLQALKYGERRAPVLLLAARIAPKVLLPGGGGERGENDTLCQKQLLPWREWTKP